MKKLTKKLTLVLVSVLVVMLCVGIMFACEPQDKEPDHTHSYSEDWKSDKDNHWKECSCGDKSEVAAHVDEDNNHECDICGYTWHSYAEAWSKDATNHWHECSCGAKSDESAHVDAIDADGNDGKDEICDICGYDMHEHKCVWLNDSTGHWQKCTGCNEEFTKTNHVDEKDADGNAGQDEICDICGYNMHVHSFAQAWTSDADNHWHACSCGVKNEEAAHVDDDGDGKCDICDYIATIMVTVKDSKGNGIADVTVGIGEKSATTNANGVATIDMFITSASHINVSDFPEGYVIGSYYTVIGQYEYDIILLSEITNTFEIIDQKTSSPIANVTLKLMDGETVAASGETDNEGKVTLTYAVGEGKYYYAIEGLTAAQYLSGNPGISKNHVPDEDSKVTTITVYSYATYTITVKCDEGVEHSVEGLTVEVGTYTGTTNEAGVAVIYAPATSSLYTVSVSGLEDGFESEDGEVGYDWWEMTTTYETTLTIKAGSSSGGGTGTDTPVGGEFAFPEGLIGTWYTSYGEEVVITEDNASIDGWSCSNYYISTSNGTIYYIFTCRYSSYGIYANGEDWYFGEAYNGNVYTAEILSDEAPSIPDAFKGTWKNDDGTIVIEIGDTSMDLNGIDAYLLYQEFVIEQDDEGNYTIEDANGYWSLSINADGKLVYNYTEFDENWVETGTASATLTKSTEGGTDTPVESDIFPEGLQGKWYTSLGKVLEIGANSITFDGTEGINLAATDNDGTTVYTFKVGMASYSLYQSGDVLYLDDNWNPAEELSQTKPVFLDAIPEAFYGTWTGVLEDEYGDMEYEYSISADGISDDYYTSTIANGDIIVMSETKIYMSGGAYLILNDGKISFDTDGTGEYVVVLSKKLTQEEIVNAAYELAEDTSLEGTYTLTGKIISIDDPYNSSYNNITVTIVVGDMTDKPIKCYRMKGTGADVIAVNDTITVTGTLTNYYKTIEFNQGCTLDSYTLGISTISIGASSSDKATVKITDNKTEGENGSEFTFTVTVDEGYEIVSVKVNDNDAVATATEGEYKATISGNTTIIVETKKKGTATATVVATAKFGTDYNSKFVNNYSDNWTATVDGVVFNMQGVNNGEAKNNWSEVRIGHKKNPGEASIATNAAMTDAITKIVINFTKVPTDMSWVNSAKLLVSANADFSEATEIDFTIATGEVTIAIEEPVANAYYKIVVDYKAAGDKIGNGAIRFDKIDFYAVPSATAEA